MASDNINEVAKYIKKTNKEANYALKRYKPDVPRVERVRDLFDPSNSFRMSFDIKNGENEVLLDLGFSKPPPTSECQSGDCLSASCESFQLSAGNHFVTLSHPYVQGSLRIYDNNAFVDAANVDETDRGAGQLFVQGISGAGETVICYTYQIEGCDFPDVFINCPDPFVPRPAQTMTTAFYDRYDRSFTNPNEPAGHCGSWIDGIVNGGMFLFDAVLHLENDRSSSANWEILGANKLFATPSSFDIRVSSGHDFTSRIQYTNTFSIHNRLTISFMLRLENHTDILGDSVGFVLNSKTITYTKFDEWIAEDNPSVNGPIEYYYRFAQVNPGGWMFKAWRFTDPEPADWDIQGTSFDPFDETADIIENAYGTFYSATITMSSAMAIAVATNPGEGRDAPDQLGGYTLDFCRPAPDALIRFGPFCDPAQQISTPSGGGIGFQATQFSFPSFVDGPCAVIDGSQTTAREVWLGKPLSVRVKGQARVAGWTTGTSYGIIFSSLPPDNPPVIGERYFGNTIGSLSLIDTPLDSTLPWTDFEIEVPVHVDSEGNYVSHWTVEMLDSNDALASRLPRYEPPFLFANNARLGVTLRNVEYIVSGLLDCSTHPFCPDNPEEFDKRCVQTDSSYFGTVPYFCSPLGNNINEERQALYTVGDTEVFVERQQNVDVTSSGGEMAITFRANGMTEEGSDGRCRKETSVTDNGVTTSTQSDFWLKFPSIIDCGLNTETYVELFMPSVQNIWNAGGQVPFLELFMGGQDNGANIFISSYFDPAPKHDIYVDFGTDNSPSPVEQFTPNTWLAIRIREEDDTYKFKWWQVGTTEPVNWTFEDTLSGNTSESWGIFADWGDSNVDTTFKLRNLQISALGLPEGTPTDNTGGSSGPPGSGGGSGGTPPPGSGGSTPPGSGGGGVNPPTPPPPAPPPPPPSPVPLPPPTGTVVPAVFGALKTAVNNAVSNQLFDAAQGNHGYTSGIGYVGIKIASTIDQVTIHGPNATLLPQGVANGIAILGDNCIIKGDPGYPMTIRADTGGPGSDANGSALIAINGLLTNNPDSPTTNTLIQDVTFYGASVMDSAQHCIYISGQIIGLTVRRCSFFANGMQGYGLHDYHEGAGQSSNYVFEYLDFHNFVIPVIMWNPVSDMVFRHCTFSGTTGPYTVRGGSTGTMRFENCTFDKPLKNEGTTFIDGGGNSGYVIV